jgi:hypothetical protein
MQMFDPEIHCSPHNFGIELIQGWFVSEMLDYSSHVIARKWMGQKDAGQSSLSPRQLRNLVNDRMISTSHEDWKRQQTISNDAAGLSTCSTCCLTGSPLLTWTWGMTGILTLLSHRWEADAVTCGRITVRIERNIGQHRPVISEHMFAMRRHVRHSRRWIPATAWEHTPSRRVTILFSQFFVQQFHH